MIKLNQFYVCFRHVLIFIYIFLSFKDEVASRKIAGPHIYVKEDEGRLRFEVGVQAVTVYDQLNLPEVYIF